MFYYKCVLMLIDTILQNIFYYTLIFLFILYILFT